MARPQRILSLMIASMVCLGSPPPAGAVAINSTVGLTPSKGQTIIRSQVRYTRKTDDPTAQDRKTGVLAVPTTLLYGFTPFLAGIVTVPYVHKEQRVTIGGRRVTRQTSGLGDITVLGKARVYTRDFPGATSRLSLLGGLELPTGRSSETDSRGKLPRGLQRGSGSWDPIAGAAYTWQSLDQEWDGSLTYQFNSAHNNFEFGDVLKHTIAYQRRILPRQLPERGEYTQLNVVLEANGVLAHKNRSRGRRVDNSGGYTLFLSPGLQVASKYAIIEVSVQLPAMQSLNGNQVETDVVVVGSVRVTF